MEQTNTLEKEFSDNRGNHLLVALNFCDDEYKRISFQIPEEFLDIEVVDIVIEKAQPDRPLHFVALFKMAQWLTEQFHVWDNAIFTFICSMEELESNHHDIKPHLYRWKLFDLLFRRVCNNDEIHFRDAEIGSGDFQTFGRAFYHQKHAPIIHIIADYIKEKQQLY